AGERAAVLETGAYLRLRPRPEIATQSGPMLVLKGKLHPRFGRAGPSLKRRDGVGVCAGERVSFAISEGEVSFASFARLFRDRLQCPNALFLDGGSVPSLYVPGSPHGGNLLSIGPMLGVYAKPRLPERAAGSGRPPARMSKRADAQASTHRP